MWDGGTPSYELDYIWLYPHSLALFYTDDKNPPFSLCSKGRSHENFWSFLRLSGCTIATIVRFSIWEGLTCILVYRSFSPVTDKLKAY
jgi:hypothetical protein